MNFDKIKKIYMIGIKGVGMTMLAQYLDAKGIKIIGSDIPEKFMTDKVLKKLKIKVIENFNEKNIPVDADLIIYSAAYQKNNNSEVKKALSGKIKTLIYAKALGEIFNKKYGIAVTGSHGKTTTTAWLGYVLSCAKLQPNVMVGSNVPQFKGNSLSGKSNFLIAEADEYQNKLQYFQPKAVVLNNIDYDHPDYFLTLKDYKQVFVDFIRKISVKGFLIANFDDKIINKVAKINCQGKIISYAINEQADYIAYDIKQINNKQYFKLKFNKQNLGEFCISLSGKHNISNALAVITASIKLGVDINIIRKYLKNFKGAERRLQIIGKFKGAVIIDDYAHHPTEIVATLNGVREMYKKNNIITVFHPHTFTRTKVLLNDFAKSFNNSNEVIVLDIYGSAREKQGGVHSKDLVKLIKQQSLNKNKKILYIPTLEKCEKYLRANIKKNDIVLLMGAGNVFQIGTKIVN